MEGRLSTSRTVASTARPGRVRFSLAAAPPESQPAWALLAGVSGRVAGECCILLVCDATLGLSNSARQAGRCLSIQKLGKHRHPLLARASRGQPASPQRSLLARRAPANTHIRHGSADLTWPEGRAAGRAAPATAARARPHLRDPAARHTKRPRSTTTTRGTLPIPDPPRRQEKWPTRRKNPRRSGRRTGC